MVRALDRYVFTEFWKIFVTTALGFPILVNIIDLTDNLDKYLSQNLSAGRIALSYLYWLPDSMFMILPAAVLFATVFSIGALTRHSEITAAKASGISFYRFIAPIFVGAVIATIVGLTIGVSLFVFALYYVCLIVGESLGKRGLIPAVVSMWMANVIFAMIALLLLAKMGKEGSTARGGDMREMFDSIRGWVRSKVGRKKPMIQPERAAA